MLTCVLHIKKLHVSEYGVHWNFFFTLALVEFIVTLLDIFIDSQVSHRALLSLGVFILFFHQFLLTCLNLTDFVLYAERTSFISANKEGICSVLGYVSIYYIGGGR